MTTSETLDLIRGDTFIHKFLDIDMSDYDYSYFTIKEQYKDNDYESIVHVSSASGLVYIEGVKQTSGSSNGEIISGSASLTVKIHPTATKEFEYYTNNCYYDLQVTSTSGSIVTPHLGEISIIRDVTKRTN